MNLKQFALLALLAPLAGFGAAQAGLDDGDVGALLVVMVGVGVAAVVVRELEAREDEE